MSYSLRDCPTGNLPFTVSTPRRLFGCQCFPQYNKQCALLAMAKETRKIISSMQSFTTAFHKNFLKCFSTTVLTRCSKDKIFRPSRGEANMKIE